MIIRNIVENVASLLDLDPDKIQAALESFKGTSERLKALVAGVKEGFEDRMMTGIRLYFISVSWSEPILGKFAEPIAKSILKSLEGGGMEEGVQIYIGMLREHKGHPALAGSAVQSTPMTRRNEM